MKDHLKGFPLFLLTWRVPRAAMTSQAALLTAFAMVHFMYKLGQAMVPRYLVKRYSGCFYEDFGGMKLTFKSVNSE